jgi:hypothetical protein
MRTYHIAGDLQYLLISTTVFVMPVDGLHLGVLFRDVSYFCKCGARSTFLPLVRGLKKAYYPIPISSDIPDTMRPTMGYRWMFARLCWMHQSDHGSYIRVVSDLDLLNVDRVNWDPWTADRAADIASGGLISNACISDTGLWMTRCLLVYMNNVELYSPERVQRQFGFRQLVPIPPPRDIDIWHE